MVKAIPTQLADPAGLRDRRQVDDSPSPSPAANAKLVAARARRLRQLIIRGLLTVVVMTLALSGMVLWQRDTARMNEAMSRIQPFVEQLQLEVARIGSFPLYFPGGRIGKLEIADVMDYPPPETIVQLRKHDGQMLLASGVKGPRLYLHPAGRPVVIGNGTQVTVEWVTEAEWSEWVGKRQEFLDLKLKELREQPPNLP